MRQAVGNTSTAQHLPHDAADTCKVTPQSTLIIGALGVVFGDIGTSPLYAFKQSIEAATGTAA